ncbi:hypothetical protein GCM10022261_07580 [Brevibacterium daeguense]|uniref:Uncharacterized protein n=1 Tax=Brevibacterium daeguense TaxID=909936 RepID=A0ABP8EH15_9MICO|nr:hypothetical protein [Brevibacterium daeguense]
MEILLKRQGRRLCSAVVLAASCVTLAACQTGDSSVTPAAPAAADPTPTIAPEPDPTSTRPTDASAADGAVPEEIRQADETEEAKTIRTFFSGLAKGVNDGDFDNQELRDTSSQERFERNEQTMAVYEGLHFPGPIPFTATDVTSSGQYASVIGCSVDTGWAQNEAGEPVGTWTTSAARIELIREDDRWKVDVISPSGVDCTDVPLEKKEWQ